MLRSRNNNKNAQQQNAMQTEEPSQTSSFTKLGLLICVLFVIAVSYFAFADQPSYTLPPETNSLQTNPEHLAHKTALRMTNPMAKIAPNIGHIPGMLRPKVLDDLNPKDNAGLQRLMNRRDKLLPFNKLNAAHRGHGHPLSPLKALAGRGGSNADAMGSGAKEITFTLQVKSIPHTHKGIPSIFVRQTSPATKDEYSHDFVLLFLHGAAYSSATWSELGILSALAKQGYVSYALDVPGYGQSALAHATDEKWLREVMDQLSAKDERVMKHIEAAGGVRTMEKKVILVTASMSGQFAMPILFHPPEQLAGMITIAPVATGKYTKEQYTKVQIPMCIVYGEQDTGLGATSKADLTQIPNHRVVMVPNGEHAAYKTDPKFFYEEVVKWLTEFFD